MIPGDVYSHTEIICWELVPAAFWYDLLSSQLSVVTWVKGLSLVTVAVEKIDSSLFCEPVNLGAVETGHLLFLDSLDLLMNYMKSCQIPAFVTGVVLRYY